MYQQLGTLQAKVEALEKGQGHTHAQLDTLIERSAKEHGARRALWRAGAAGGGAAGLVVAIASWWVQTFGNRGS